MASFKHILFPVDFSEQNCHIAPYVACMARRYNARVTLLHAMDIPMGAYPAWPVYGVALDLKGLEDDSRKRLESFQLSDFEDVSTTRLVMEGDPAWRIADYAEKENADLIMMPTHGYGPFRQFLLGSVTAKVLHDVKCPVWTSAHTREAPAPPSGYKNVLCAVDLSEKSLPLLRWASLFACEQGATLKLLHAVSGATAPAGFDIEGARFRSALHDLARQDLANLQKEAGTSVESVVKCGEVADVVRQAAEENSADLVVIGRGAMSKLFGRMRTNVYSIIRDTQCPVISV